jgi:hypothetical protein
MSGETRQAGGEDGELGVFGRRGVYVPPGMSARDIMVAAHALEARFDVAPYEARRMVRVVLSALDNSAPEPCAPEEIFPL